MHLKFGAKKKEYVGGGRLWRITLNLMGQDLGKVEVFMPGGVRPLARESRTSAATWVCPGASCCVWRNVLQILSLPNLEKHEEELFLRMYLSAMYEVFWGALTLFLFRIFMVVDGSVSVGHTERIPWSYTGIRIPKESQNVYENWWGEEAQKHDTYFSNMEIRRYD